MTKRDVAALRAAIAPNVRRVLNEISTVAATDTTVLLLGETGTGKELLAPALHAVSERKRRALVIYCAGGRGPAMCGSCRT